MATAISVIWTSGDTISETKLDNMVSNDSSEDIHASNGLILNNNVPYKIKNAAGTAKNVLNKNASDQTTIGENNVRATRYVNVSPGVELLNQDPGIETFNLDVTANTSARAYAAFIRVQMVPNATSQVVTVQDTANVDSYLRLISKTTSIDENGTCIVILDSGQTFDVVVSHSGITAVKAYLLGYWEYVD